MDTVIQFEGTIYENGYGLIAQRVMRDKTLPKQSKLIYSYMCSFAGTNGDGERTAFPSVSLQCDELGMSEDTYYKWRKYLVDRGYIRITRKRKEGAKFDRNIYSILAVPVESKKEESNPYQKIANTDPHPKKPNTVNPSTDNLGTNSNNSNNNSFNKKKQKETIKETNFKDFSPEQKYNDKEKNKEELLKASLKSVLPNKIFYALDNFSDSYQELYEWIGILFRSKNQVEKDNDQLILLENYEETFFIILQNAIRNIKTNAKVNKPSDYLFITIKSEIEKHIASQTRLDAIKNKGMNQDGGLETSLFADENSSLTLDTDNNSNLEIEKAHFKAMLAERRENK
ncbi:helix-turn-helix domain-containing protein [Marinococcus halotolerans]|uniref:helix-turn-helix domain-containing protein n=1 Tax=Marinococcus halotolerans TaxID=301092 RepID=UPI0003B5403D|nr:helix-turn-helix domain-containing protein [Marinococcus halotolerans]